MTTKNDITGDNISSKQNNDSYRQGWGRVFGVKPIEESQTVEKSKTSEKPETIRRFKP